MTDSVVNGQASNPVLDAIAKAQQAAAAAAGGNVINLPTPVPAASVPAVAPARGAPLTFDDVAGATFVADLYLKVNHFGLQIGQNGKLLQEPIQVVMDMAAAQFTRAIKAGDPARYWKTYDGITTTDGGSWADALVQAARIDSVKGKPYASADFTFQLIQSVGDVGPEKVIGHSLSTTNFKKFKPFYEDVKRQGLDQGKVLVELGHEALASGAKKWGVVTFKLIGPAA